MTEKKPKPPSTAQLQEYTLASAAPHRFDQVVSGVRLVVSNALPSSSGKQVEQWQLAAVQDLRPELRPYLPLVVVMMGGKASSFGTAVGDAAAVVWFRRKEWYADNHRPITARTLEHEAAHIYQARTGDPRDGDWETVMRSDADADADADLAEILVLPEIVTAYPRDEWVREDWASSVEHSLDSRFARQFPNRARYISDPFSLSSAGEASES